MTRQRQAQATAIKLLAIGLWSGLALSTVAAAGIPPFQLLALSFGVAFASGMIALVVQGRRALSRLRQPRDAWVLAFLAIFLYHALYFYAPSAVPAAQANLVAYLWPLLIVLFSALAPGGGRLRLRHLAGAALGLAGAVLLFLDEDGASGRTVNGIGYLAALGCALI